MPLDHGGNPERPASSHLSFYRAPPRCTTAHNAGHRSGRPACSLAAARGTEALEIEAGGGREGDHGQAAGWP